MHKRLQMNTPLFRESRVGLLRDVAPALHPIVWVDEGTDLDEAIADKLRWMIILPTTALQVIAVNVGWLVGQALSVTVTVLAYRKSVTKSDCHFIQWLFQ